jgi:fructose-1,6-bisphosphatase/inositol monophosphatase family enzyme
MNEKYNLGEVNGHHVGRVLKEAVRRATVAIRKERTIFEAHVKESYSGTMDDVFTSADKKAQNIYLRTFEECFPNCGVIAEEDSLIIPCKHGFTAYFTVDPLDGTKAYVRRQSHGVSTMVALVEGGNVISAFIGDTNTEEMYGYRPNSSKVHRITRLDDFETLQYGDVTDVYKGNIMLRDPVDRYSHPSSIQALVSKFKNYEVMGSSIGTWMARLWKREVCAVAIPAGWETPWDSTPIIGISLKLGYVFLRFEDDVWKLFEPKIVTEKYYRGHDVLILHPNDIPTLFVGYVRGFLFR